MRLFLTATVVVVLVQLASCSIARSSLRVDDLSAAHPRHLLEPLPNHDRSSGPSSLVAYCAEAGDPYVDEQPVMADWLGFGTNFEAHITHVNEDGTYDVVYELDDRTEKDVRPSYLKPRKTSPNNVDASKDAACQFKKEVGDLNEAIDKAAEEAARWMSERRKKKEERERREEEDAEDDRAENFEVAGAPGGAPGPASAGMVAPGPAPAGSPAPAGIGGRSPRHHVGSGDDDDGLKTVLILVFNVDSEIEIIEEKAILLAEKGVMDPELQKAVDDAVQRQGMVNKQTNHLKEAIAVEKEAHKALVKTKKRRTEAREDSKRLPRHQQHEAAHEKAHADVEAADDSVEECMLGLQTELQEVKSSARTFDTGVTPNGAKWWRYRYEYSVVEAGMMLIIVPLMVLYKRIYAHLRKYLTGKANSTWFKGLLREIETIHLAWLQYAAGEVVVVFFVVLTIWLLATFGCLDFLVFHIRDEDIHLPTQAEQYRIMAVNVSMVLGCAIIMYHALVYSVVRATVRKFQDWMGYTAEEHEAEEHQTDAETLATPRGDESPMTAARSMMSQSMQALTISGGSTEFQAMKSYFVENSKRYPNHKRALEELAPLSVDFPFQEFLSMSVRLSIDHLLELTATFWITTWLTFACFLLLHRFAHIAYVRIMSFCVVLLIVVLAGMGRHVHEATRLMLDWHKKDAAEQEQQLKAAEESAQKWNQEWWLRSLLQWTLFFLCYGFVRMLTAPWLWQIYFYTVLFLTLSSLAMMWFFAAWMAPLVPVFYAGMSIPPTISEGDVRKVVKTMKHKASLQTSN